VHYEGNVFRFPGGGTQFPQGADKYIDQLASVIPIAEGKVRTALDTGCGVREVPTLKMHAYFYCAMVVVLLA